MTLPYKHPEAIRATALLVEFGGVTIKAGTDNHFDIIVENHLRLPKESKKQPAARLCLPTVNECLTDALPSGVSPRDTANSLAPLFRASRTFGDLVPAYRELSRMPRQAVPLRRDFYTDFSAAIPMRVFAGSLVSTNAYRLGWASPRG